MRQKNNLTLDTNSKSSLVVIGKGDGIGDILPSFELARPSSAGVYGSGETTGDLFSSRLTKPSSIGVEFAILVYNS